jgi:hypothetical protein
MSTEHSRSTSATGPSGCTTFSSAGHLSQARSCTSAGPSANTSPNHSQDQRQFIQSLAIAIAKEKIQIPLPGTMGTPFSQEKMSQNSSKRTSNIPPVGEPTRQPEMLSQHSRTTARKYPGHYQDDEWISDKGLGAIARGAEGVLSAC